jgi:hypothetical protein
MAADHDLAVARVIEELSAFSDPPPDLRAARLEFRRRTRRVVVVRRFVRVALLTAAVVLTIALVRALPEPHSALLPAKQLPSGLPVGILEGQVPYEASGGQAGYGTLRLVVRTDATGSFHRLHGDLEDIWPVRFVGEHPGRVVLMGRGWSCSNNRNELTLDFIARPDSITITHAVLGECSAFPGTTGGDFRGVVLRVHHGKGS